MAAKLPLQAPTIKVKGGREVQGAPRLASDVVSHSFRDQKDLLAARIALQKKHSSALEATFTKQVSRLQRDTSRLAGRTVPMLPDFSEEPLAPAYTVPRDKNGVGPTIFLALTQIKRRVRKQDPVTHKIMADGRLFVHYTRGLAYHEIGHVIYTPRPEDIIPEVSFSVSNLLTSLHAWLLTRPKEEVAELFILHAMLSNWNGLKPGVRTKEGVHPVFADVAVRIGEILRPWADMEVQQDRVRLNGQQNLFSVWYRGFTASLTEPAVFVGASKRWKDEEKELEKVRMSDRTREVVATLHRTLESDVQIHGRGLATLNAIRETRRPDQSSAKNVFDFPAEEKLLTWLLAFPFTVLAPFDQRMVAPALTPRESKGVLIRVKSLLRTAAGNMATKATPEMITYLEEAAEAAEGTISTDFPAPGQSVFPGLAGPATSKYWWRPLAGIDPSLLGFIGNLWGRLVMNTMEDQRLESRIAVSWHGVARSFRVMVETMMDPGYRYPLTSGRLDLPEHLRRQDRIMSLTNGRNDPKYVAIDGIVEWWERIAPQYVPLESPRFTEAEVGRDKDGEPIVTIHREPRDILAIAHFQALTLILSLWLQPQAELQDIYSNLFEPTGKALDQDHLGGEVVAAEGEERTTESLDDRKALLQAKRDKPTDPEHDLKRLIFGLVDAASDMTREGAAVVRIREDLEGKTSVEKAMEGQEIPGPAKPVIRQAIVTEQEVNVRVVPGGGAIPTAALEVRAKPRGGGQELAQSVEAKEGAEVMDVRLSDHDKNKTYDVTVVATGMFGGYSQPATATAVGVSDEVGSLLAGPSGPAPAAKPKKAVKK